MSNTLATSINVNHTSPEIECRARAISYLAGLIGGLPESLTWDSTHRLQGHVHLGCRDLVVIATRDPSREPVVLTEPNWDAVRRSAPDQRLRLIESCAITDQPSLMSVLASDEFADYATTAA